MEQQDKAKAMVADDKAQGKPEAVSSPKKKLAPREALEAIHEIENSTAAQWANETWNAGARAAARVVRMKFGFGPDEILPPLDTVLKARRPVRSR